MNLSLASSPGDFSPKDSTEQLVNSTSKLVMSMSELSLGTKGALILRVSTASQLIFSNQGCSLISLAELWPSRLLGSFCSSFFSRSWNFGLN